MKNQNEKQIKEYVNKFKDLRNQLTKNNDVKKVCDLINDLFFEVYKNNLIDEVIKEINKHD
ncbi:MULTISPECIES: hypothetical protein [Ureaplasma]|uniref:Uncharacterized protein UU151 n=5 Tax=Ureaplasma TaxID=2129 RepID=Y151_UREPA|nr:MULTISPECIES: hypothetical protein [Ureaplasma]Q9PQZ3.1 RecName: Full=Uncharacterized protein UU151 [Ureaplasma parvum serovar 3 str. ATCC 700970]pir/H82927/ hypothetical protein UU151 [imported] - Ureaplasma urealyticum [Ureaplasma urealyticum]RCT49615.1 hypothetical protein DTQ68_00810 [Ureaplasma parvum]AAF30557.1 unique hypothetical [Ureaplasma parvum serovar 3 str. ATCC 700970]ACA32968.1 conserved hypothetical protein [Ureaplasma parvum serovar 3 str. ATCC 27815]ACI60187.1 conserved h